MGEIEELKEILNTENKDVVGLLREGKVIRFVQYEGLDLSDLDLSPSALRAKDDQPVTFLNCLFLKAKFIGTKLEGAKFQQCIFIDCDFSKARIKSSKFTVPNFVNTDFSNSQITNTDLSFATFFEDCQFTDARLFGVDFVKTRFLGANFSDAKLNEVNLYGATIESSIFREAVFTKSNLTRAAIDDSDFSNADISGSYIFQIKISSWDISGIKCSHVYNIAPGLIDPNDSKHNFPPYRREFEDKEFEEAFKTLPTIEYFFGGGIPIEQYLTFDGLIELIGEDNPNLKLKTKSQKNVGLDAFLELTFAKEEYREEVEAAMVNALSDPEKMKRISEKLREREIYFPISEVKEITLKLLKSIKADTTKIRRNQEKEGTELPGETSFRLDYKIDIEFIKEGMFSLKINKVRIHFNDTLSQVFEILYRKLSNEEVSFKRAKKKNDDHLGWVGLNAFKYEVTILTPDSEIEAVHELIRRLRNQIDKFLGEGHGIKIIAKGHGRGHSGEYRIDVHPENIKIV